MSWTADPWYLPVRRFPYTRELTGLYVGPGDIAGGATAWWGLRAYSAASIGSSAIRLREDGGNTEQDFATVAGGGLNLSAISAFKGGANLFVTKLYDQTGNGIDQAQATMAKQPPFFLNAIGTLPSIITTSPIPGDLSMIGIVSLPQPFVVSQFFKTITPVPNAVIFNDTPGDCTGPFAADEHYIFAGGQPHVPCTDNVWHAVQDTFNGAASEILVDTTSNIVDASTVSITGTLTLFGQGGSFSFFGFVTEVGLWSGTFSGGQRAAMSANQHTYYGV